MRPDHFSYSHILHGWSVRYMEPGAAERANEILDNIVELYIANKTSIDPRMMRETTIFNIVIMAHARSGDVEGAMKVLRRMEDLASVPDRYFPVPAIDTYNSALVACARARIPEGDEEKQKRVLELALSLLQEIQRRDDVEPDSSTYGELFRVCSNLIIDEEERAHSLEDLFHRCCEAGCLNPQVIKQIRLAISSGLFHSWFGPFLKHDDIDMEAIPYEWKKNNRESSKSRKTRDNKRREISSRWSRQQ
jgi:pentatricopeptide repeat protein